MDNLFITQVLASKHKKSDFDCGKEMLNGYIRKQASQDIRRRLSACFVLTDKYEVVKGYYTLSSSSIPRNQLAAEFIKKLPASYTHLPVTLLGRLALDKGAIGKGMGALLLADALKRAFIASEQSVASMAVVVDPIDQEAINFYLKYGFLLLPDSQKMFLPMNTVAKLF
jgi:GNAT superfamily N-acetyltransferase